MTQVDEQLLLQKIFQVGSVYFTPTNTNPHNILGFGTWQLASGRTVVGLKDDDTDFNQIGKTGGSKYHSHEETLKFESEYNNNTGLRYAIGESVPSEQIYTKEALGLMPFITAGYMLSLIHISEPTRH